MSSTLCQVTFVEVFIYNTEGALNDATASSFYASINKYTRIRKVKSTNLAYSDFAIQCSYFCTIMRIVIPFMRRLHDILSDAIINHTIGISAKIN